MVPADFDWRDLGDWSSLHRTETPDDSGNVTRGPVTARNTSNSYLRSEGPLLAVTGLEDMTVVAMRDAVLIAGNKAEGGLKPLVEQILAEGHEAGHTHPRVYRPWGFYETVHQGPRFQVKRITVYPGAKLSLQKHARRAEHWVVVNGTARVRRDDDTFDLKENQSTYIPLGAVHRLENPGQQDLTLIEVQSGDYLGEDDIVRLDDVYGRDSAE